MESEDVVTFCQRDLPLSSFAAFEDMRRRGELCDLTIIVQDNYITAHRVILAAVIPYFKSLFTSGEVDAKGAGICVGDLDPAVFESLVDFAYSSRVTITAQNVRSLLEASQFLQLSQVRDACVEFLLNRFRLNTILEVHILAHNLNNTNLIEKSNSYIRENFEEFSKSEDFLALPHSCVKEIISEEKIAAPSEEVLFDSVIDWVKFSPSERHTMLPDLLYEVRMVHLPTDYLVTRVDSEELIRTSIPCRDLVTEVKNYHLAKNKSMFSNLKTQPRKLSAVKSGIYGVCYNKKINECSVHYSDCVNSEWHNISSRVLRNICSAIWHVVSVNDKMFLFFDETIATFNLNHLEWKELDIKHKGICLSTVLSYGNTIYCFGSDEDDFLDKVRCFDAINTVWLTLGTMRTGRWGSAAATLNSYIYVTGGCREERPLATVEKFDPSASHWSEAAPMLTERRNHGCVSMKGKIYVCGGYTGTKPSCTAEMYDPLTDQWKFLSSMKNMRSSLSFVSYNGQIYALGGRDGSCAQDVEIYDPESDQWKCFDLPAGFEYACCIET